jgi:uncharacterized MAPEG superfamily protein
VNIAHLCVLVAAALPYLTIGSVKAQRSYDNAAPRDFLSRMEGWRARANWAHHNHFEAFAPFAAAVIMAELAHAAQARIDTLAVIFIMLRIAYTFIYIGGVPTVRTLVWIGGVMCVGWLFLLGL